jgi:hypothetical protein
MTATTLIARITLIAKITLIPTLEQKTKKYSRKILTI